MSAAAGPALDGMEAACRRNAQSPDLSLEREMEDLDALRPSASVPGGDGAGVARKRPKPARGEAYGILNAQGDFWTHDTFRSERAARDYMAGFWRGFSSPPDMSRHTVVRVNVTVSIAKATQP